MEEDAKAVLERAIVNPQEENGRLQHAASPYARKCELIEPDRVRNPRILSLSMVRNEQDIIEPFVRHNMQFVDYMVILDNGSHDQTRNILSKLLQDYSGLVIADDPAFGYNQSERMRRMLALTQTTLFADYVLFLDADEFIDAPSRGELETALLTIPFGGVGLVPWRTFVLPADNTAEAQLDVPRTMKWRRAEERPLFKKAVLRLDSTYQPDLQPSAGNHDVHSSTGRTLSRVDVPGIAVAHFPLRSRAQLLSKIIVGWMANLAIRPNARESSLCYHWRQLFDRICGGVTFTDAELSRISLDYAHDVDAEEAAANEIVPAPPPANYDRRYSTGVFADPLRLVARAWEQTLAPTQPLLTLTRPDGELNRSRVGATAFDAAWHWDNLFIDIPPFQYAFEKWHPSSVLDIGCGIGGYLALAKALGTQTRFGIDGLACAATALTAEEYLAHDLATPVHLGRRFDLVLCLEVAEHLSPDRTGILYDSIVQHAAERVIFSAAELGQPGHGHINCRPFGDWLALWDRYGWVPELAPTLAMRSLATLSWLRRNLVVLRRATQRDGAADTRALLEVAARDFAWYGQAPGVREYAFREELPSSLAEQQGTAHPTPSQQLEIQKMTLEAVIADLGRKNDQLQGAAQSSASHLHAIEQSTIWRATALLWSAAAKLPPPVRRALRRLAKAGAGR